MIQLNGTSATELRDRLIEERSNGNITPKQITERMVSGEIPEFLRIQILQMVKYRIYDRCTNPIEQAMEAAVHQQIVKELMDEEKNKTYGNTKY